MTEKRDVQLSPAGLGQADYVRVVWAATAAFGVTREQIEDPAYWAHVAAKLKPKAKIEVTAEDDSFYAEYLVTSCDKTWAKVVCLKFVDLTATAVTREQVEGITSNYSVEFRGPKKWSVLRKSDRSVLQEGLHSREDGNKWLAVHLNTQGVAA